MKVERIQYIMVKWKGKVKPCYNFTIVLGPVVRSPFSLNGG